MYEPVFLCMDSTIAGEQDGFCTQFVNQFYNVFPCLEMVDLHFVKPVCSLAVFMYQEANGLVMLALVQADENRGCLFINPVDQDPLGIDIEFFVHHVIGNDHQNTYGYQGYKSE